MTPVISIIIPALNEERALPACLDALASQTLASELFQVILVDNGSTDRTLQIARSFESRIHLTICEKRGCSIAALRNLGAHEAQSDSLAFLDADCVPKPSWLAFASYLLSQQASERERRVVGAGYQIPDGSTWVARAWYGGQNRKNGTVSYVSGGNLVVSRAAFIAAGYFDDRLETSEDWEFCQRAASRGIPTVAYPALAVVHLGTPQTLGDFYRKQYWHGTHALKAVLHSATGWKSGRAAWFAVWTLLSVGACCVGLTASLAAASAWMAIASLAVLLAAPMAMASRTAFARHWPLLAFPLTLLYLTYGVARALCLIGFTLPRPAKPVVPDSLVG